MTCRLVTGYWLPVTRYMITVYHSTVRSVQEDWNIQLRFLFASQFDVAEDGPVCTDVLTALWCKCWCCAVT